MEEAVKRIAITGTGGFIGTALAAWLADKNGEYCVERLNLRDSEWKNADLSVFSAIVHAAGIAHVRNDAGVGDDYYRINRDLTVDLAMRAKAAGVGHFIFLSSIIVYGDGKSREGLITEATIPQPLSAYGKSKLEAEQGLERLSGVDFHVAILRLPMVYGRGSKGNFRLLARLAKTFPVFPHYKNRRSMIYIDNLCRCIERVIALKKAGTLYPQNAEHSCTSSVVKALASIHGRPMLLVHGFEPVIRRLLPKSNLLSKVFGDLAYDFGISTYDFEYQTVALDESLQRTES